MLKKRENVRWKSFYAQNRGRVRDVERPPVTLTPILAFGILEFLFIFLSRILPHSLPPHLTHLLFSNRRYHSASCSH